MKETIAITIAAMLLVGCEVKSRIEIGSPDPVKIGQVRLWPSDDPFEKSQTKIKILDVKDGYCQYVFIREDGSTGITTSGTTKSVAYCYKVVVED